MHALPDGRFVYFLLVGRHIGKLGDIRIAARADIALHALHLRPLDVGGLTMAHYLEGTGLVMIGLAQHGVGNFDFALDVTVPG